MQLVIRWMFYALLAGLGLILVQVDCAFLGGMEESEVTALAPVL